MIYPQNFEQKIGFDQIRRLLKEKCLSTLGEERVMDMAFSDHFGEVEERLDQVTEFVRILQEEDNFPAQYFFDVRPSLKRIRVEGMYLDEPELFDLRRSLETIRDIVRFLQKSDDDEEESAPLPLPEKAGERHHRLPAAHSENKRHPLSLRKNQGQRLRRTGTHPSGTGKYHGKHLPLTEQYSTKCPVRGRCGQRRNTHHA